MELKYIEFYNKLVELTRNNQLYKNFNKNDEFSDRLIILLIHFGFFLKVFKTKNNTKTLQQIYDFVFRQLELSIREIGYGDQSINKQMKKYLNFFHNIIDKIHFWENLKKEEKVDFLNYMLDKSKDNEHLIHYFENYKQQLQKNNLNSYLKSVNKQ
ncbi:ubiquinol-cytochrome C reductase [Candidatus Pelagibacter sp.]|jgi:cytochrome b pre-mRNA-processing protein 3|nr:ubiquinol-cytochrome C reductase [Candidatus Pelagibacter sp.]